MFALTMRGMLAHKIRLILTSASIALGVAFLAGTLVLTDTMGLAFDQLFGKVSSGTDAVVRTHTPYTASEGAGTSRPPIKASILDDLAAVDGVRVAEGSVSGYALLTDNDGKAIITNGGAPTVGYSMPADEGLRGEVSLTSGTAPEGPDEVVIDATSAEDNNIALGSAIQILFTGPAHTFTVVGTVEFGGEKNLGGTTSAYFETATAQTVLGQPGYFDTIEVSAESGVSQRDLADRLATVIPDQTEVMTGTTVAQENSDAINDDLKIVGILFTAFAAIALFVGGFIIWNTFTMVVTQRSRETALLRAVGATRGQVLRTLMLEAVLIGSVASALGVGIGMGVAKGLKMLMDAFGFALPSTSLQLQPRTIVVSLLVGTLITVLAALIPARRATKVLPVEALRESTPGANKPSKRRAIIGLLLTASGVAGVLSSLYGGASMTIFAIGLVAVMAGVLTSLPIAVGPLAALIGVPLRWRGLPGELAEQNARRNPRRTSSTAAALMIGLALVVSMSVFASSLKASYGDVLADQMDADLFIQASSVQGPGFSADVVDAVDVVPGVEVVSPTSWGEARFAGKPSGFSALDPSTAEQVLALQVSEGSISDLTGETIMVSGSAAKTHGWGLGDVIETEFAATGKHRLTVVAIYDGEGWIQDDYVLSAEQQAALAGPQLLTSALIQVAAGSETESVKDAVGDVLAKHPDARVMNQDEFEKLAGGTIDSLLTFVTVMLLLAVLIALLGIINTLALSVFERTRELGLLRAVGMTRGQVRSMVRWESVVISLIGALTGAALGIGIGLGLAQALKDEGINAISIPVAQVAIYVGLAAVAGVLAALGPARSAAKVDVLRAVVSD